MSKLSYLTTVMLMICALCTPVQAGLFSKKPPEQPPITGNVFMSEDFNSNLSSEVPVKSLTIGSNTLYSDKPALTIVNVGTGDRALSLVGSFVRFRINPTNIGQGQALQLQFTITYPNGATEDKQSLRFGFYSLSDITDTTAVVAADQGLGIFTVPSVDAKSGKTSFIQDLNAPDRAGKWPGFMGGGPGSRQSSDKCGSINFLKKTAQISMTIAPIANGVGVNPSWQVSFSIKIGKKSITNRYVFDSSNQFDLTSFNTVGIRVGATEQAYVDDVSVSLLKLADAE